MYFRSTFLEVDLPIEELGFSTRVENALKRSDYNTSLDIADRGVNPYVVKGIHKCKRDQSCYEKMGL